MVYKHIDGSYHGYATLHYGNFKTVIAHFLPQLGEVWTEEHPITKWRLDKILIGDVDKGWFAYDCNVVRDENGTLYLIYNAGYPNETLGVDIHIKAWRLLDPATLDPNFTPRPILSPEGYRSETRLNGLGRYVWKIPLKIQISDEIPMHEWIQPILPQNKNRPISTENKD